jgi:hypothetical protein
VKLLDECDVRMLEPGRALPMRRGDGSDLPERDRGAPRVDAVVPFHELQLRTDGSVDERDGLGGAGRVDDVVQEGTCMAFPDPFGPAWYLRRRCSPYADGFGSGDPAPCR